MPTLNDPMMIFIKIKFGKQVSHKTRRYFNIYSMPDIGVVYSPQNKTQDKLNHRKAFVCNIFV